MELGDRATSWEGWERGQSDQPLCSPSPLHVNMPETERAGVTPEAAPPPASPASSDNPEDPGATARSLDSSSATFHHAPIPTPGRSGQLHYKHILNLKCVHDTYF